jgi:Bacterial SH3 domain
LSEVIHREKHYHKAIRVKGMLVMKSAAYVIVSLLGVGAVAGGTVALRQQPSPPPAPKAVASPQAPTIAVLPDKTVEPPPKITPIAPPTTRATATPTNNEVSPAIRKVSSCKILMAIVKDDNPPLNVRDQPNGTSTIVGTVSDGTFVSVKQEQDGWLEITEPKGWIAKTKTASQCGQKVEQVSFGAGQTSATLTDEFLGAGSHQYKLALGKGQTLTVTGAVGPMPAVIAPDGKYLVGMDEAKGTWATELPSSGEYTFEMDSNFRGYKYEFLVDAK